VTLLQGVIAAAFAPLVAVRLTLLDAARLSGAMVCTAIAVTALGITVGSRMRTFEGFGVISNFVVLPLYFLSGGVFPPAGMPGWMRVLIQCNPITYAVDLMRAAIGQPHVTSAIVDLAVLTSFAIAMCIAALAAFRRSAG
jgi:ABC-2 type transport system permease protein